MGTKQKPADFIRCGTAPATVWKNHKVVDRNLNPYDDSVYGTWTHKRVGEFVPFVNKECVNNQDCGLLQAGACHGCDAKEECAAYGMSSTLFVTHKREFMHQKKYNPVTKKYEQARYHCRREGPWGQHSCECKCDAR